MKSFSSLTVLVILATASAFVPMHQTASARPASLSPAFLHPDQAKDLEDCAYDLMKQALEQASETNTYNHQGVARAERNGPVAWCRRIIQNVGNARP